MKVKLKGKVVRAELDRLSKAGFIAIETKNSHGHIIRKNIRVNNQRVIRTVGAQKVLITPVVNNNQMIGYVVEGAEKIKEVLGFFRDDHRLHGGRGIPMRRVPRLNKEVYDLALLPDGVYICSSCGRYAKPGHKCK